MYVIRGECSDWLRCVSVACAMWFADDVFMDDYDDDILLRDTLEHEHNVSKSGSTVPLVIWLCIIIIIFFFITL